MKKISVGIISILLLVVTIFFPNQISGIIAFILSIIGICLYYSKRYEVNIIDVILCVIVFIVVIASFLSVSANAVNYIRYVNEVINGKRSENIYYVMKKIDYLPDNILFKIGNSIFPLLRDAIFNAYGLSSKVFEYVLKHP